MEPKFKKKQKIVLNHGMNRKKNHENKFRIVLLCSDSQVSSVAWKSSIIPIKHQIQMIQLIFCQILFKNGTKINKIYAIENKLQNK